MLFLNYDYQGFGSDSPWIIGILWPGSRRRIGIEGKKDSDLHTTSEDPDQEGKFGGKKNKEPQSPVVGAITSLLSPKANNTKLANIGFLLVRMLMQ